jgi:hypothetical protein
MVCHEAIGYTQRKRQESKSPLSNNRLLEKLEMVATSIVDCAIARFAILDVKRTAYDGAQLPRASTTVLTLRSTRTEAKRRRLAS